MASESPQESANPNDPAKAGSPDQDGPKRILEALEKGAQENPQVKVSPQPPVPTDQKDQSLPGEQTGGEISDGNPLISDAMRRLEELLKRFS